MIPKTDIYNNFKKNFDGFNDKPIAVFPDKASIEYKQFSNTYENFKEFMLKNQIELWHRIAIITSDEVIVYLLSFPIIDYAVVVPCEYNWTEDKYRLFFKNVELNYIITDNPSCAGAKAADAEGVGIITISYNKELLYEIDNIELTSNTSNKKRVPLPGENEFVMIKTTSGTTGNPKVLPVTANGIESTAKRVNNALEKNEDDVTLMVTSLYIGLTISRMYYSLYHGGKTIFISDFKFERILEIIEDYKVTNFTAAPAVLSSLSNYIVSDPDRRHYPYLRFLRASGAPMNLQLMKRLKRIFDTEIVMSYGTHETLNISTTYNAPKGYKEGSVGISTGLELKTLDGEIMVRGASVFPGYIDKNSDNSLIFSDGWFHTGDEGYIDADGYIFITGRIKEMINRGGEKVSPYEVEGYLLRHPEIVDAVVFPCQEKNSTFEEVGTALIMKDNKEITLKQIRSFLEGSISDYVMPSKVYIVKEFPLSLNGKVQRKLLYDKLKQLNYDSGNKDKNVSAKSNIKLSKSEKKLKKIWINILKKRDISINDRFTDIGGDSLSGAAVLSNIERMFGISVPVELLFKDGLIKNIAAYLDNYENKWKDYDFIVPIKESGKKKPIIFVHTVEGVASIYNQMVVYADIEQPIIGINFNKNNKKWKHPVTFEQMAETYIEEIQKVDPDGPYNIFGFCYGGVLAMEIAIQLQEKGYKTSMLVMLDTVSRLVIKDKASPKGTLKKTILSKAKISKKQISEVSLTATLKLINKKVRAFISLITKVGFSNLYWFSARKGLKFLFPLTRNVSASRYAFFQYKPKFYNGPVHFIRSLNNKSDNERHKFWENYCRNFKVIEMDFIHKDLIKGKGAEELMAHLNTIMENIDA